MNAVAHQKRPDRRYPRYKIALQARIGGHTVTVSDWSANGLGLSDVGVDLVPDRQLPVTVMLNSIGSSLELTLMTRIVWVDRGERRAGLEILSDSRATKPLSDFADLYLAGRLVEAPTHNNTQHNRLSVIGNQMSAANASEVASVHAAAPRSEGLLARLFGLLVFAGVGLIAFLFLFDIVYQRLFTFEAISARVATDVEVIYQPRDGVVNIDAFPLEVRSGQEMATVKLDVPNDDGDTEIKVLSSCDCYLVQENRPQSSYFARAGSKMFTLVPKEADMYISLNIPFRQLGILSQNPQITLTYLDGMVVEDVDILAVPKVDEDIVTQLEILVSPGRDLPADAIGQPVYAVFDTAPFRQLNLLSLFQTTALPSDGDM